MDPTLGYQPTELPPNLGEQPLHPQNGIRYFSPSTDPRSPSEPRLGPGSNVTQQGDQRGGVPAIFERHVFASRQNEAPQPPPCWNTERDVPSELLSTFLPLTSGESAYRSDAERGMDKGDFVEVSSTPIPASSAAAAACEEPERNIPHQKASPDLKRPDSPKEKASSSKTDSTTATTAATSAQAPPPEANKPTSNTARNDSGGAPSRATKDSDDALSRVPSSDPPSSVASLERILLDHFSREATKSQTTSWTAAAGAACIAFCFLILCVIVAILVTVVLMDRKDRDYYHFS